MQKRIEVIIIKDLQNTMLSFQDKILPNNILQQCALLVEEVTNEVQKVKLSRLIITQFNKNIEANKFRQQKQFAEQILQERLLNKEIEENANA